MNLSWCIVVVMGAALVGGCASGGGKAVVKGAARGATHGVIEDVGKTNAGKGAAHGAFGAAAQVKDANQAQKKRDADAADSK